MLRENAPSVLHAGLPGKRPHVLVDPPESRRPRSVLEQFRRPQKLLRKMRSGTILIEGQGRKVAREVVSHNFVLKAVLGGRTGTLSRDRKRTAHSKPHTRRLHAKG